MLQMESGGIKILVYSRPQDSWLYHDPLTFDLAQIFTKKLSKSVKINPISHLKGGRDTS